MVLYCIALHCVALYACEHHNMIHIHTPIYHKHNPQTQDTTRTQAARDDLQARLQDLDRAILSELRTIPPESAALPPSDPPTPGQIRILNSQRSYLEKHLRVTRVLAGRDAKAEGGRLAVQVCIGVYVLVGCVCVRGCTCVCVYLCKCVYVCMRV
jgi:hypothetical protein